MAAVWLTIPFASFAKAVCEPSDAIVSYHAIPFSRDTIAGQLPDSLRRVTDSSDSLLSDSLLIATGVCDSTLAYCDYSKIERFHPDSLRLGMWRFPQKPIDTLSAEQKTQKFYDSLEVRSQKSYFWKLLHDMVVVPVSSAPPIVKSAVVNEATVYGAYNGKRIEAIDVVRENVFDPARSYLEKAANAVHVVTSQHAIRRDLLFKVGDTFDAEAIVRCKQLLRSRQYIADANIRVIISPTDPDAVILCVTTRDSWSISGDGSVRGLTGQVKGEIYDANFLGTGDRLSYQLSLDWRGKGYEGSMLKYYIPNLLGTFYEMRLTAGRSFKEQNYGGSFIKRFIQPTDYEGGVIFEDISNEIYVRYESPGDTVSGAYMIKYSNLDLWGGKSWYKPSIESSIYFMGRFNNIHYKEPPKLANLEDPPKNPSQLPVGTGINPYFYDQSLSLVSFGVYDERFLTTNLIYGYGYDEYVATGYRAELTMGYMDTPFQSGFYGGVDFRAGGFTPVGYFMGDVAVGSFYDFRREELYRSALSARFDYFTNLLGDGKYKVRQFVSTNYLTGWNRSRGFYENIWFTRNSGPREILESPLGHERLVLSAETVLFTPWQPLGFRTALYSFADVGLLGYDKNVFRNDLYATVGVGIRMKNEMLIFGTIQLSLFVNFGKQGILAGEWVKLTTERRMQTMRYIPEKPQVVNYQ